VAYFKKVRGREAIVKRKPKARFRVGQVVVVFIGDALLRIKSVSQSKENGDFYYDCGTLTAWDEYELRAQNKRERGPDAER